MEEEDEEEEDDEDEDEEDGGGDEENEGVCEPVGRGGGRGSVCLVVG